MAQLIEDRRKREEEIADKRVQREKERETREREVKIQMEAMQMHLEKLMKMVEDSKAPTAVKAVSELSAVNLVHLSEQDDIEAYQVTFKRAHKIKGRWAHYLAPQLTGWAQLAFPALLTADSAKYDAIKQVILQWYDINEETYRRRFRSVVWGEGETNQEHAVRLLKLEKKWLKNYDSLKKVYEAIGLEHFLNTLPTEKRVRVYQCFL